MKTKTLRELCSDQEGIWEIIRQLEREGKAQKVDCEDLLAPLRIMRIYSIIEPNVFVIEKINRVVGRAHTDYKVIGEPSEIDKFEQIFSEEELQAKLYEMEQRDPSSSLSDQERRMVDESIHYFDTGEYNAKIFIERDVKGGNE